MIGKMNDFNGTQAGKRIPFVSKLKETDSEFSDFFGRFVFDEVAGDNHLEPRIRMMAILSALIGCQGVEAFREILPSVPDAGVTPIEVKEIAYQATAYLGIGRTFSFLNIVNEVFEADGICLPLPGQGTTTPEDRMEKGEQA